MKYKNHGAIGLAALLLGAVLAGCAAPEQGVSGSQSAAVSGGSSTSTGQTAEQTSGMFTDRDREIGYDESDCVTVTLSDSGSTADGAGVSISGSTVTITDEGSYLLAGSLSDGQVVVEVSDTQKVHLVMDGVSIANTATAPLYVVEADKVFVALAADSQNALTVKGEFVAIDDNNIDAALFSKGDLTLNGSGALAISNPYGNGVTSKDDLVITSGSYIVTAANHALEGKDSVRIASGTFTLTAGEDALHSDNSEDADRGFVYIDGGSFEITSGDDGIHAETAVTINGGTLQILQSYEGIEGYTIAISGGEIDITSSDDGLNAAGGVDSSGLEGRQNPGAFAAGNAANITIQGGSLYISADGDGIDSNGSLTVTGGEIYVLGSTNSGNGALDYNGTASITGGIVVATGASGMAQNFGDTSTQASMLVTTQNMQSGDIVVQDSGGKELLRYTPAKSYNSALISLSGFMVDESYTVVLGDDTQTITLTSLIYGNGGMGRRGGVGGMGGRGNMDGEKPQRPGTDQGIPPTSQIS